ncbi:zinc-dependent metalloprotease family protein [Pseudoalteromonas sp. TB64]|uniref:zinc-dependent metalloprotease family protein n=1 Tax=Pseudoalteromonas sp. TB64 TaxID=1938600 RepID=UPI0004210607|nr:zinc-dependent metalloprotease family protein [Pseudoalteromonas sp. TB64]
MKKIITTAAITTALCMASAAQAETIDIGILYTDQSAAATSNIDTKISQLIAFSNQVYSQNGVDITLRLVGKQNLGDYAVTPSEEWLDSITDSAYVNDLRDDWKADMVAVLGTGQSAGNGLISCGLAWVGQGTNGNLYSSMSSRMYSISAIDCGATTFLHELGHNQGLAHSRQQGDTSGGVYTDGMGHGQQNVFASIMAYPHVFGSATQYDYFSNPNWTVSGYPFGVTNESYAIRTVTATKTSIANFK